ncbi:MAG: O-methyltransferase [Candidatus Krumholzibacteriia bacterium]
MISFIPEDISAYAEAHTSPPSHPLDALAGETRASTTQPEMLVGGVEGTFLKLLARSLRARRTLEIGTFTGYSALMLAEGMEAGGEVVTCEIDRATAAIARKHWAGSPHGQKITLELGPALETLGRLQGPFDLVFIDADKGNYIAYWEACVPMVRRGGLVLADNVLWSGRVLDPKEADDHALVAFNTHVRNDPRVESVMLTIRDGITMACKR